MRVYLYMDACVSMYACMYGTTASVCQKRERSGLPRKRVDTNTRPPNTSASSLAPMSVWRAIAVALQLAVAADAIAARPLSWLKGAASRHVEGGRAVPNEVAVQNCSLVV